MKEAALILLGLACGWVLGRSLLIEPPCEDMAQQVETCDEVQE